MDNFTWANGIALAGVILAYAGAIGGVWRNASNSIRQSKEACDKEIKQLKEELNEFKMEVTKEYASWDTVRSLETRLTERMDSISDQVMNMPDVIVDRLLKFMSFPPKP